MAMDANGESDGSAANSSYAAKLAAEVSQLKLDNKALQEELAQDALDNSDDDLGTIRSCFVPHVPQAIASIIMLAESAESESVRLSAAKYIVEYGPRNVSNDDEFRDFLKKIQVPVNTKE
jgi:hypothetical protein